MQWHLYLHGSSHTTNSNANQMVQVRCEPSSALECYSSNLIYIYIYETASSVRKDLGLITRRVTRINRLLSLKGCIPLISTLPNALKSQQYRMISCHKHMDNISLTCLPIQSGEPITYSSSAPSRPLIDNYHALCRSFLQHYTYVRVPLSIPRA